MASELSAEVLSAEERSRLGQLADVLIPGTAEMPAASVVKVHDKWVDRVLEVRPDLIPQLRAVLDAPQGRDPAEELDRLESDDPALLDALKLVVSGAYYISPRTRRLLEYPGQIQKPVLSDEAEYYLDDSLLEPLRSGERRYRTVPGDPPRGAGEVSADAAKTAS